MEYYYSNCNSNSTSVKETVTIEMNNGTTFIDAGIKLNQDGTFNSSLLTEQKKYRVKIQGSVVSNKTTQPIYIDLIYEIPAPVISTILSPPEIIKNQDLNITIPESGVKCVDGCEYLFIQCRMQTGACPTNINTNVTKSSNGWTLLIPAGSFNFSNSYDFMVNVVSKTGKQAYKNVQVTVLDQSAPKPLDVKIQVSK